MKTFLKFPKLIVLIFLLVLNINSFAQSTSANATANIVSPISITAVNNLIFGDIAVSASLAGTVVMSTSGTRTKTGGVLLPVTGTAFNAASFTVSGVADATYAITLPASTTISAGGPNSMTVNTFTSNPSSTGTLSAGGTQTLSVGATLNVAAGQAQGTYTGTFSVTVAYN